MLLVIMEIMYHAMLIDKIYAVHSNAVFFVFVGSLDVS